MVGCGGACHYWLLAGVIVEVLNTLRPSSSDILYGLRTLYTFLDEVLNYVEKVSETV
jgi:hypothetical protein